MQGLAFYAGAGGVLALLAVVFVAGCVRGASVERSYVAAWLRRAARNALRTDEEAAVLSRLADDVAEQAHHRHRDRTAAP